MRDLLGKVGGFAAGASWWDEDFGSMVAAKAAGQCLAEMTTDLYQYGQAKAGPTEILMMAAERWAGRTQWSPPWFTGAPRRTSNSWVRHGAGQEV